VVVRLINSVYLQRNYLKMVSGQYSYCIGKCDRIKRPSYRGGTSPYAMGLVRCMACDRYFSTERLFCECCGSQLRRHARFPRQRKIRVRKYIS